MSKKRKKNAKNKNSAIVIKQDAQAFIDEYFINGFSQIKAAQKIWPELSEGSARVKASVTLKSAYNRDYIRTKQMEVQEAAKVTPAEIARELKTLAFSDITAFLGKTEDEIKQLPAEQRRALSKVTIKHKRTRLKDGTEFEETTRQYQLKDSLNALEKLAKHIGFYELDNRQKGQNINVLSVLARSSPETLNQIEQAMRTIDVTPSNPDS